MAKDSDSLLDLVLYPAPVLNEKTEVISTVDEEIAGLARRMIATMHHAKGVGLAGPQVGVCKQIIIVNPSGEPGEEKVYLNPKIVKRKGKVLGEEGCLSLPGIYGNVLRSQWIRVSATLLSGEEITFEEEDFPARVLQHEIDHLSGVLFITKIQPAEQVAIRSQLHEMEQRYDKNK